MVELKLFGSIKWGITSLYTQLNTSKMNSQSIRYAVVWQLDFAPEYVWTKCGKCFNSKTGKRLKQSYNSRCIGYNIKGRFRSLSYLRKHLVKIEDVEYPF